MESDKIFEAQKIAEDSKEYEELCAACPRASNCVWIRREANEQN